MISVLCLYREYAMHELAFHGVVTYTLPIKAFVNRIKNLDWWRLSLIYLIIPFQSPKLWSLDLRAKHSNASLVSEKMCWLVDISCSEFVLIPWSVLKKNIDHFDPSHKRYYRWHVSDYHLSPLLSPVTPRLGNKGLSITVQRIDLVALVLWAEQIWSSVTWCHHLHTCYC